MNRGENRQISSQRLRLWSAIGYAGLLLAAPFYGGRMLTSGKNRAGLRQRLTLYSAEERRRFSQGPYLWIHAVSVGELMAARPLLQRLKRDYPDRKIFVTTVTPTGQELAQKTPEVDESLYFPLDLYPLSRRLLSLVRPQCLIILETEIWPNAIRAAAEDGIPLFMVNARLSDRSYKNYLRARWLFEPVLSLFSAILAQSDVDAERFRSLHAPPGVVSAAGNLKFEAAAEMDPAERAQWRQRFGIRDDEIVWLGGSTFPGEEAALACVFSALCKEGFPLRLLIAPRHVERAAEIERELKEMGFSLIRRSQIGDSYSPSDPAPIILLDTIGELRRVYSAADIVFMGKSLCGKGGQNPLEPAAWGRPIFYGENMQNFRDVSALLLRAGAARCVKNEGELIEAGRALCESPQQREEMGRRAQEIVRSNRGALQRIMETLAPALDRAAGRSR
ncbi:MAG: 3-deoxy-D-manno-octulosonic acid transferase [Candidatus Omnitrophota bacterium]